MSSREDALARRLQTSVPNPMLKSAALALFSASLLACAIDPGSRCEQAAAAVAECTGSVPDGFVEACEANVGANGEEAVDALLDSTCEAVPADGKADGFGKDAFAVACSAAVGAAYFTNWLRSPSSQPLPKAFRDKLRPEYGALVDSVRVSWGATLIDTWTIGPVRIELGGGHTDAQTFGSEVFLKYAYDVNNPTALVVVSHELQHARQSQQRGGLGGFERDYCRAFWDSNYSYSNNALEVEAYANQHALEPCLRAGGTNCTVP